MKLIHSLVAVAFLAVGLSAQADPPSHTSPIIHPGPTQQLDALALSLLSELAAVKRQHPGDFDKFFEAGNRVTGASVQHLRPGISKYALTIRGVVIDPRLGVGKETLIGGAIWNITRRGLGRDVRYESRLVHIR